KYINTPETLIYSKGRVIYGLDKAKVDIKKENIAIVVEGNMDTIACHQSGFKNTVASSGTAFTHTQIILLKRYTDNLLLAFDFDLAGQNAVNRGIELALQEEMEVKIISIPFGKDPDECLKSSPQGKELWEKAVKSAQPIMEYYFLKATSGKDFSSLADIKEAKKIFLLALAKLGDAVEKSFWLKKFSNTINISESDLREELRKVKVVAIESRQKLQEETEPSLIKPEQIIAERTLSLLIKFPDLMNRGIESDFINFFIDRDTKKIAEIIIKQYCQDKKRDFSEMVKIAETEGLRHLIESLDLLAEQEYAKLKYPEVEQEFIKLLDKLKKIWVNKKIEELRLKLKLKEQESSQNNSEAIGFLMEEINNLSKKYLK
ncbi:MAG: toprim domain-containing protein, partial [Patescibacteria group bacterium]